MTSMLLSLAMMLILGLAFVALLARGRNVVPSHLWRLTATGSLLVMSGRLMELGGQIDNDQIVMLTAGCLMTVCGALVIAVSYAMTPGWRRHT